MALKPSIQQWLHIDRSPDSLCDAVEGSWQKIWGSVTEDSHPAQMTQIVQAVTLPHNTPSNHLLGSAWLPGSKFESKPVPTTLHVTKKTCALLVVAGIHLHQAIGGGLLRPKAKL